MSELACSIAVPGDSAELLRMMAAFNAGEGIPFDAARCAVALEPLLQTRQAGLVLLYQLAGRVAGYAVITWNYDLEFGGRDAFLTELWIEPAHRGRGHGRRALELVEQACGQNGAAALHLAVRPDNQAALGLYTQAGYSDWPRRVLSKRLRSD